MPTATENLAHFCHRFGGSDAWRHSSNMRRTMQTSTARAVKRVLVLGDGHGQLGRQTGVERQALSLASAMILLSTQRDANGEVETGWQVQAMSLAAVRTPMPRLYRPLSQNPAKRLITQAAGYLYLSLPRQLGLKLIPERLVEGEQLPPPYNDQDSDFSDTVIIAAGSATAGLAVARRHQMPGSKLIKLLHPRGELKHFDVVVTPWHDFAPGAPVPANVVTTHGSLHDINLEKLAAHESRYPANDISALPRPRITVMLGGPRGSMPLHFQGWSVAGAVEVSRVLRSLAGPDGSIVITASRRTPPAFARRLQLELQTCLGMHRVFFDDGTSRNRYLFMLATSDALVITRDSANMISEALPTNAPIFITGVSGSARLDRFVNNLAEQKRITLLTNASRLVEPVRCVPTASQAISLERTSSVSAGERELNRVARQILDRLRDSSIVK